MRFACAHRCDMRRAARVQAKPTERDAHMRREEPFDTRSSRTSGPGSRSIIVHPLSY